MDGLLEPRVDREVNAPAGYRGQLPQHLDDLAVGVGLGVLPTVPASEQALEAGLQARLADHLVGLIPLRPQGAILGRVEGTDVPEQVTV